MADGVSIQSNCQYFKVHNNTILNWGHACIEILGNYAGQETSHNELYNNDMDSSYTNYCRGIQFTAQGVGYLILNKAYRNKITNVSLAGIRVSGNENEIYYNIIDTTFPSPVNYMSNGCNGILLYNHGQVCKDNKVYNNVIYNVSGDGIHMLGRTDGIGVIEGNLIKNNIVLNWGNGHYGIWMNDDSTVGANTWKNNCIYKSTNNEDKIKKNKFYSNLQTASRLKKIKQFVYYGHSISHNHPHTIAEFNAENGTAGDVINNNISSNPLFVDATHGNFNLQARSPCIDMGTYTGLTKDYAGNIVPQGEGVDIGAFEYQWNNNPFYAQINAYSPSGNVSLKIDCINNVILVLLITLIFIIIKKAIVFLSHH
ncbi:MAG: choice-of-anchor Q domain-containing protein [Candidatus Heimdallarchaeaceae archaeon]